MLLVCLVRDVTNVLLYLYVAFIISSLMVGWMTNLAKRAGLSLMGFVASAATLFLAVVIVLSFQPSDSFVIVLLWCLFGFLGPLNMITFAALAGEFPSDMTGRMNACLSVFWLGGGFVHAEYLCHRASPVSIGGRKAMPSKGTGSPWGWLVFCWPPRWFGSP